MSDVDWSRLRSLTAREITAALIRDGFVVTRQSGGNATTAIGMAAASPWPVLIRDDQCDEIAKKQQTIG